MKSLACLLLVVGMIGCQKESHVPVRTVADGHCPKDNSLPKKYTLRGELRDETGKVLRWASITHATCPGEQLMVMTYGPESEIEFESNGGPTQ